MRDRGRKGFKKGAVYVKIKIIAFKITGCRKVWVVIMANALRKIGGILAAVCAAGLLAGCGQDAEVSLHEMKVENYVTLGDYMNLDISVEKETVSDEACDQLLLAVYQSNVTAENGGILDRAVAEGDTVNIDYVGKRDGVAFSGGTASGSDLKIGSGSFIPGFEAGLVGAMPGETRDLNLSFPENYKNNPDLAGQAVVFTVTVNFIQPGMEDLKDSVVATFGLDDVSDLKELRQFVYDYLDRSVEQEYLYSVQDAIIEKLTKESTISDLPEYYVENYREIYRDRVEKIALNMNTTPDMYTNYYFGMNSEDYAFLYGEVQARQELLLQAIANKEGWGIGDDELDGLINDYALENGFLSGEELEAEIPREQLRNFFMSERVMGNLVDTVMGASQGAE